MGGQLLVEMRGITKRFPGVTANRQADLRLYEGEIHALLGENGSGKSTLMSVLSGLYRPDEGEIYIRGRRVLFRSPRDSINAGIGMVHQHFRLVDTFTVAQNVILGSRRTPFFLRMGPQEKMVRDLSEKFGLRLEPGSRVWQLSLGERQRVEIVKLLYRRTEVLVLDEPTAVLTPAETRELFDTLKKIAGSGQAVVVITHKLREVMEIADRVTVLRGGHSVKTLEKDELSELVLARAMIGRDLPAGLVVKTGKAGKPVLVLEEVEASGEGGLPALRGVSLDVREGEILGIAGVAGNGQKELAEVVAGLRRVSGGRVLIGGEDVTGLSARQVIDRGVSYIPEDRLGTGLVPGLGAADNLILKDYRRDEIARGGFINYRKVKASAQAVIEKFGIKIPGVDSPVRALSGGNLQRLLLAREISAKPRLIVAVYPVRGLDIAATEAIHDLLLEQRAGGCAILLISDDLEEILKLSDRIAVFYRGEVKAVMDAGEAEIEKVGLAMVGAEKTGLDNYELEN